MLGGMDCFEAQASQPVQVRFEPGRRIGWSPVYRIVQEALPFKERKIPGKVPHLSIAQR